MAPGWQEIYKDETALIDPARLLLQSTASGYQHLDFTKVNDKMQHGTDPPTPYNCLYLYSYPDTDASHPQVSAFFFLRRRKKKGKPDKQDQWAFCLSVGAMDEARGGLSADDLRDALNDVCRTMARRFPAVKREVMHLPGMQFIPGNMNDVFAELLHNDVPPKQKPRLENKGTTITLGYPWVPLDGSGNEVCVDFDWCDIVEKP